MQEKYIDMAIDWVITFAPRLGLAIVILIVGLWIVKRVSRGVKRGLQKTQMGPEVEVFVGSIIDIMLKIAVVLAAVATLGVEISAIFGLLAAASFAVGLALQGFLGNFASGLTIIFFKPYRVGDWVRIADTFGKVQHVEIFSTEIISPGEKTIIIPNGQITDSIITNYSTRGKIRLELEVSMPYSESFPKVRQLVADAVDSVDAVLAEPEPQIGIDRYDSHFIVLSVRPFVHPDDFWHATYDCYAAIKSAMSDADIAMAYSEGVELGKIGK